MSDEKDLYSIQLMPGYLIFEGEGAMKVLKDK